jgi:hypothetical protein
VAYAYDKEHKHLGDMQRFVQIFRLIMSIGSSGLFGCPAAMTDGAAYTLMKLL